MISLNLPLPTNVAGSSLLRRCTIVSNTTLGHVVFAGFMKSTSTGLVDYASIRGKLNTNNRSPYKGTNTYSLPNGDTLNLAASLSAAALRATLVRGIGYGAGENGVLTGNAKDWTDGAGNHYSFRFRCVSNKP